MNDNFFNVDFQSKWWTMFIYAQQSFQCIVNVNLKQDRISLVLLELKIGA